MKQLIDRINEVIDLKTKYNLKSHEVFALHIVAILEESDMNYEKLKEMFCKERRCQPK